MKGNRIAARWLATPIGSPPPSVRWCSQAWPTLVWISPTNARGWLFEIRGFGLIL